MEFSIQSEYGVDSASDIKNSLVVANYRACERVLMNSVHFPKADLEYTGAHYEFLSLLVLERGLTGKIAALDMAELRSDERSERRCF
jgi:hypothetical protein